MTYENLTVKNQPLAVMKSPKRLLKDTPKAKLIDDIMVEAVDFERHMKLSNKEIFSTFKPQGRGFTFTTQSLALPFSFSALLNPAIPNIASNKAIN